MSTLFVPAVNVGLEIVPLTSRVVEACRSYDTCPVGDRCSLFLLAFWRSMSR